MFNWNNLVMLLIAISIFYFVWLSFAIIASRVMKAQSGKLLSKIDGTFNRFDLLIALYFGTVAFMFLAKVKTEGNYFISIMFAILSFVYFYRSLTKTEIREKGIFSREGFWQWEDIKLCELNRQGEIKFKIKKNILYLKWRTNVKMHIKPHQKDVVTNLLNHYVKVIVK